MRYFKFAVVLVFSIFLFMNCAGTKKGGEESAATQEEQQQKELDDIEALLGISTEGGQESQATNENGEKLKLLETNEVTPQQGYNSASQAAAQQEIAAEKEKEKLKKETQRLKKQLKEKDRKIAELNALLDQQAAELEQVKQKPTGSAVSYTGSLGTVSGEEYKMRYEEGRAAFENRQYRDAIQIFESLLASNSMHPLADNAQYWIGECHYALRQYDAAIMDFEKVLTFPNSNKRADAQFKLGLCYLRKGQREKALEEFNRLREEYPNSPYNARAQALMSKL